jgi:hypothetical protein
MKHVAAGRAILIALLFIALPVCLADEQPSTQTEATAIESSGMATVSSDQAIPGAAGGTELGADENKVKLTKFFAIGLVINIFMMTLFGVWAVRQWRKSDNER